MRVHRALICAACLGAAVPAVATGAHFTSPSGRIDCLADMLDGAPYVDCLVQGATWAHPRPRPASCEWDWVPTQLSLTRGRVGVGACRGDVGPLCYPGPGRCTTLAYGTSIRVRGLRCTSRTNGVTCRLRNGAGAGFRIAREGYVVFR